MERNSKLGDRMPDRRAVKWGDMKPGESHLSEEWHDMTAGSTTFSDKWDAQRPSSPKMSERWVDMSAGESDLSDKWNPMKQEGRTDPYSMAPSSGDRSQGFKKQIKETPDNRVGRADQHTEFGKTREI